MSLALVRTASAAAIIAALTLGLQAQVGRRLNVLDANTARDKELLALPHVTPALVRVVIDRRPFASIKELDVVLQSLSAQQRTDLYGRLFVAINLNTAPRDEILLIPGVGDRMAHEFEEYRPYRALAAVSEGDGQVRRSRRKWLAWSSTSSCPSI